MVGLIILYVQLGPSALISGILILLMVIVQYVIGQKLGETQDKIMVSQAEPAAAAAVSCSFVIECSWQWMQRHLFKTNATDEPSNKLMINDHD